MLNCRENDGRRTTLGAEMESRHISAQWRAKPEPVGGVITAPELFSLGRQRAVTNCLIYRGQRSNTGTTAADRLCFSPFYLMINLPSHALSLAQSQTGTPSLVHPGGLLNVACQERAKWVFCFGVFWPNCLNFTWPPGCNGWLGSPVITAQEGKCTWCLEWLIFIVAWLDNSVYCVCSVSVKPALYWRGWTSERQ